MRLQRTTSLPKLVTQTLAILSIFCHLPVVEGAFDPEDLAGLYRLKTGVPTCSDLLRFTQSGLNIPSQAIEQDNESCQGGNLNLFKNAGDGHALLLFLSQYRGLTGDYYSGRLTASLRCSGQVDIPVQTVFVFFTAEDDFQITLPNILGVNSAIEMASGSPIMQFRRGSTYIFVGGTCVYEKDVSNVSIVPRPEQPNLRACFPSSARVRTRRGEISMRDLQTADVVQTGVAKWGRVIGWTHRDRGVQTREFVRLVTRGGQELTATSGHYVYANGIVMPAERVCVGDALWSAGEHTDGASKERIDTTIVSVTRGVMEIGLYNPQTTDGNIVVNGFVVTTYTEAVPPVLAHALLTPIRALAVVCLSSVHGLSASMLGVIGELRSVLR